MRFVKRPASAPCTPPAKRPAREPRNLYGFLELLPESSQTIIAALVGRQKIFRGFACTCRSLIVPAIRAAFAHLESPTDLDSSRLRLKSATPQCWHAELLRGLRVKESFKNNINRLLWNQMVADSVLLLCWATPAYAVPRQRLRRKTRMMSRRVGSEWWYWSLHKEAQRRHVPNVEELSAGTEKLIDRLLDHLDQAGKSFPVDRVQKLRCSLHKEKERQQEKMFLIRYIVKFVAKNLDESARTLANLSVAPMAEKTCQTS